MNTYFMQKSRLFAASLGVVALTLLPSCQDEEFGYTKQDIMDSVYAKRFAEAFGDVDPNHTWNTASQTSITVDINFEGLYTVKVYTANPRYSENNVYLVGQFDGIEPGTHTFQCDMPATVECAYVGLIDQDGNRMILPAQLAMGKASVEFGSKTQTRTVYEGTDPFTFGPSSNMIETTMDDIRTPLVTLPEHQNNTGKVSQNFEYISMGAFTIYPIYSITSNRGSRGYGDDVYGERLGIYTYDQWGNLEKEDDEIKITWIWHMNRGVLNQDKNALTAGCWYEAHKTGGDWQQMYWFENNIWTSDDAERNAREPFCVWQNDKFKAGYDKIRTQGIVLQIPSGTRFGFVLDTDHGYVYSNSSYNLDEGSPSGGTTPDHIKDTYAATFHNSNNLYLAFEDWGYGDGGHDNDFNDLVLRLKPEPGIYNPLIIDKDSEVDPIIYIVACEDLGGTYDWDFNDVVFGIEHVSGQTNARVKLLAAGGTLPISLIYKNNDIEFLNLKQNDNSLTTDLHAALGAEVIEPVNVNAEVNGKDHDPVYSKEFTVDRYAFNVLDDAADFKIKVVYSAGSEQRDIHVPNYDEKKKVPQAFLIADPKWQWPTEHQDIRSKYSEFENWVKNYTVAQNWTHTIWGEVREFNTIPSGAVNLVNFQGAITYNGNVATIKLAKDQMDANASYQLSVMLAEQANAEFWYNNNGTDTKIEIAENGEVQKDKLTTFGISNDVVQRIKNSGNDGKLTLTFTDNAQGKLLLATWYKVGTLLDSKLEVKSPIEISVFSSFELIYTTENQESPVTFSSSNELIVYVSDKGIITGRIAGEATITLHQSASEHYAAAEQQILVKVLPDDVQTVTQAICNEDNKIGDWTALGADDFKSWNSVDANSTEGGNVYFDMNIDLETSTGYGNSSVYYLNYAKLDDYDVLKLVLVAKEDVSPRFLFNRKKDGGEMFEINSTQHNEYVAIDDRYKNWGNGIMVYYVNLRSIREKYGYVHLNAIKSNYVLYESVQVVKKSN